MTRRSRASSTSGWQPNGDPSAARRARGASGEGWYPPQRPQRAPRRHGAAELRVSPDWNRLVTDGNPFVRYEFLRALEQHRGVGEHYGWIPRYLVAHEGNALVGAAPLYIKTNSYGEFVFDWAWADAYERAGLPYFPKLVIASPYSPVTGPRLLAASSHNEDKIRKELIKASIRETQNLGASSLHCLFTDEN